VRVLVATDDRLGPAMAGSALRAWEIATALKRAGHEVRVAGGAGSTAPGPGPIVVDRPAWRWPDVVVAAPWSLPPRAFATARRLVIDGATPLLAELAMMPPLPEVLHRRRTAAARLPMVRARADALMVAGAAQLRWWTRVLGRARPDLPILDVPFGVPDDAAGAGTAGIPGVPSHHAVILWWGGVWPWLDLDTLLAARARLGAAPVSVVVPVGARPGSQQGAAFGPGDLHELASHHGLGPPRVVGLEHWVPYAERHRLLNRAALLAVLHRDGPEAELCFRTRALDGLWAGVPLLLSEGGAVAELARRHGWGGVVRPGDVRGVAAAVELLLAQREQQRCRANLERARQHWTWSRLVEPLAELLPRLPSTPRTPLASALVSSCLLAAGLGQPEAVS
jgi:glycosyltransferase involved in cell wall biosynthesis